MQAQVVERQSWAACLRRYAASCTHITRKNTQFIFFHTRIHGQPPETPSENKHQQQCTSALSQTQLTILQHMRQNLLDAVTYCLIHDYDRITGSLRTPTPSLSRRQLSRTTAHDPPSHDEAPQMPIPTTLLFTTIKSGKLRPPRPLKAGWAIITLVHMYWNRTATSLFMVVAER